MITINNRKFARKGSDELIESLFNNGGTCCGEYKEFKGGIHLYKPDGNIFMAVIDNKRDMPFFVSVTKFNNRNRYSYSTSSIDEKYMGFNNLSYSEQYKQAELAINQIK